MKQRRKMQRDFSYGGYALLADGRRIHAFVQVEGSKIFKVSIPKKENDKSHNATSDATAACVMPQTFTLNVSATKNIHCQCGRCSLSLPELSMRSIRRKQRYFCIERTPESPKSQKDSRRSVDTLSLPPVSSNTSFLINAKILQNRS